MRVPEFPKRLVGLRKFLVGPGGNVRNTTIRKVEFDEKLLPWWIKFRQ